MQIQSIQICVQTEDTALAKNTLKIKRTLNLRFSVCVCVCVCVCEALSPAPLPLKISSLGSLNRGLLSFADVISQNLFESLSPALSDLPVASPCILDLETVKCPLGMAATVAFPELSDFETDFLCARFPQCRNLYSEYILLSFICLF